MRTLIYPRFTVLLLDLTVCLTTRKQPEPE